MAERGGWKENVNKVEVAGGAVAIVGLLASAPALALVGLLAVTGAEGYKYYQKSKN